MLCMYVATVPLCTLDAARCRDGENINIPDCLKRALGLRALNPADTSRQYLTIKKCLEEENVSRMLSNGIVSLLSPEFFHQVVFP